MKICFLAAANSIHSHRWVKFFADRGHEIRWISFAPSTFGAIAGVDYTELPAPGLNALSLILRVRSIVARSKPDVLHAHYAGMYGMVGAAAGFRPFVVTAWGSDVIYGSKSLVKRPLLRWTLRRAALVTCDAQHMKERMIRLGIDEAKIKIIRFGIDTDVFSPRDRAGARRLLGVADRPTVISTRNLAPVYDVETLVRAVPLVLARMPETQFLIAGEGKQKDPLSALAAKLGVSESVRFIGFIPNEKLPEYLSAADAYVSTSLSDGGIAASTAEAMATGLPVVVTDSGENRSWIEDGRQGFMAPVRSPEVLADKIHRLLADEAAGRRMGILGRDVIRERNDYRIEMGRMEALYLEIIGSGTGRAPG